MLGTWRVISDDHVRQPEVFQQRWQNGSEHALFFHGLDHWRVWASNTNEISLRRFELLCDFGKAQSQCT